jgi:hypothetical protein
MCSWEIVRFSKDPSRLFSTTVKRYSYETLTEAILSCSQQACSWNKCSGGTLCAPVIRHKRRCPLVALQPVAGNFDFMPIFPYQSLERYGVKSNYFVTPSLSPQLRKT